MAKEETRHINILNEGGRLPEGRYLLIELFCTDPTCDCRRVFFNVTHVESDQLQAVIAYGWEDREFYRDWFGREAQGFIDELKGPSLNTASPQSPLAPILLKKVESVLEDEEYVDRIERHYEMFKHAISDTPGHAK
ncbi:hypothetical protein [Halonotius pteroides]|uniref:Uncharacterized protein n=1 Tax=Halonotius pteroides TaxID=268735 RepID=A0A3A6QKA8_9EURY|nr:hypothetical protein [Halonotius pteroides]RJX47844.1 hypothetical protein DP106_13880 [Halonotius pteroides]